MIIIIEARRGEAAGGLVRKLLAETRSYPGYGAGKYVPSQATVFPEFPVFGAHKPPSYSCYTHFLLGRVCVCVCLDDLQQLTVAPLPVTRSQSPAEPSVHFPISPHTWKG